jgi:molybdate transport system ATP-binding protein
MDEPLASLDVVQKAEIMPFIERLRDELGLPIAFVSHSVVEVVRLADTLVILSEGNTVECGPVEDVMSRIDLPQVAHLYEAGAAIAVIVEGHDDVFDLTRLSFAGRTLTVPRLPMSAGTRMRVRIRARDVALSLTRPEAISVLNVLEGRIAEIGDVGGSQVDILVDVGCPVIARITRKSFHDLDLKPNQQVFALIKAVAIDRSSGDSGWRANGR